MMMSRMTVLLLLFQLPATVGLLAQQPSPQTPEDAYTSRELIAWSQLQVPQPIPQPLPPKQPAAPQPEQPKEQQPKPSIGQHEQQEPVHSHTEPAPTASIVNH